jgi:uncharacterized iron-regulated membrane protein
MPVRSVVLVTHRWLGLASAVVLAIVGGTGAAMAWPPNPIRALVGPLHETLRLGRAGSWLVVAATCAAVVIECGGIILWWRRRVITVSISLGWRRTLADLHHVAGATGLILMLLLAVTGALMSFITPAAHPDFRRLIVDLHTARTYPWVVRLVYSVGTLGFVVQAATGVFMWWRRYGEHTSNFEL